VRTNQENANSVEAVPRCPFVFLFAVGKSRPSPVFLIKTIDYLLFEEVRINYATQFARE
jgi:hypothetical protein